MSRRRGGLRLRVNPVLCDGHGVCAELLPEMVHLDDWGFPIIDPSLVPSELETHARRAIAACPTLALLAQAVDDHAARRGRSAR